MLKKNSESYSLFYFVTKLETHDRHHVDFLMNLPSQKSKKVPVNSVGLVISSDVPMTE